MILSQKTPPSQTRPWRPPTMIMPRSIATAAPKSPRPPRTEVSAETEASEVLDPPAIAPTLEHVRGALARRADHDGVSGNADVRAERVCRLGVSWLQRGALYELAVRIQLETEMKTTLPSVPPPCEPMARIPFSHPQRRARRGVTGIRWRELLNGGPYTVVALEDMHSRGACYHHQTIPKRDGATKTDSRMRHREQ